MADNETTVKVKTVGDTEGAEKVSKSHEKIGHSAEKASRQASNSCRKMVGSLTDIKAAAARVNQALTAFTRFGFIASGVESIANLIDKLTAGSRAAKKEAEELAKANQKAADAKTIKELAEAYEFSGGQIENIARKKAVDDILEGNEQGINMEAMHSYFQKCRLTFLLDHYLHFFLRLLNSLFDSGRMNTAINDQLLQRNSGYLTTNRIKC